jgi:hypothetical protein
MLQVPVHRFFVMRRIFISHSTEKDDRTGRDYLDALVSGLEQARENGEQLFEVFLDRRSLQGGDDWNLKIVNHLVYCHAAVIVLSRRALSSDFVKFEVSNLVARRDRERDPTTHEPLFPVVPVVPWLEGMLLTREDAEDVIKAELSRGFWNAITFGKINWVGPSTPTEVIPQLLSIFASLQPPAHDSALDELERNIAFYFERLEHEWLERAARSAEFDPPAPDVQGKDAALYMARHLLLCPLAQTYKALDSLRHALQGNFRPVFELLAPSWVSAEAAHCLATHLYGEPPRCCIIAKGEALTFTPEMYLQRATGKTRNTAGKVFQLTEPVNAGHDREELRQRVLTVFEKGLPLPGDINQQGYVAKLAREINDLAQMNLPVVVAMMVSPTSLPLLVELSKAEEFRQVTFLGLSPDRILFPIDPAVVCLTPEMEDDQEGSAYRTYQRILGTVS